MKANKKSSKRTRKVPLFALGYEWRCPDCQAHNTVLAIPDQVRCARCRRSYRVGRIAHTYARDVGTDMETED